MDKNSSFIWLYKLKFSVLIYPPWFIMVRETGLKTIAHFLTRFYNYIIILLIVYYFYLFLFL